MSAQSIWYKIKYKFFPSEHQKIVKKWRKDGGDERFRYDYDLNENSLVLDLGGYAGDWAHKIFSQYRSNIFVFEPIVGFAAAIEKRFIGNDKVSIEACGLGGRNRKAQINISADGSSIFGDSGKTEEIEIRDISEWLQEHDVEKIDLMKLNIEGGEYEVIDRLLDTGNMKIVKNIQVQFHHISTDSESELKRMHIELAKTHKPTYQYKFVWENWTIKQ